MRGYLGSNSHWKKYVVLLIVLVLFWFVWSTFFHYEDCKSQSCFSENLKKCDKAIFIAGNDMIFRYKILGKDGEACNVEVELLQGELDNADSRVIEGHKMVCSLPFGVVVSPESDISLCHGLLKEGLQDLVIKKLHTYLVQNLGRLNLEMADLPSV